MNDSLLRSCKACGKDISKHSPFCRNCGHPQPIPLIIWGLVLLLLLMVTFYFAFTIYGLSHVHEIQVDAGQGARSLAAVLHAMVPAMV